MTPAVWTVSEDATVPEVASLMLKEHLHRLVVVRQDEPVGIISTSDLLGLLMDEA
jgi:CBS domain-containing protein